MQYPALPETGQSTPARIAGPSPDVLELRVLLAEAEAGRARLAWRTDALERRLAALESIVRGAGDSVSDARDEVSA